VQAARAEWLLAGADAGDAARAGAVAAVGELADLLPLLLQDRTAGADEAQMADRAERAALPMSLFLVAWQALRAAGDERDAALLARGRNELRARAARITDPTVRRDYLQVAEHRRLLAD
jgi:hypothetical protein